MRGHHACRERPIYGGEAGHRHHGTSVRPIASYTPRDADLANGRGSGAPHLRAGERVRRHLHPPRSTPPQPRRGRPLPLPPGRVVGPVEQRLPRERRPALPRRRQPPRVRDAGVRLDPRSRRARQGGRAHPRRARAERRTTAARRGHPRRSVPVQEQHRQRGQLVRLSRELPRRARRRLLEVHRRADPVPRDPPGLRRRGQGAADRPRRDVLHRPARRAHLGRRVERHHTLASDHQHARRAARRRRALPPPARDRRRLEHERVRDVPQDRRDLDHLAHARRGRRAVARPHAREPDPRDPRDQSRHHLPAPGASRQRARALGGRDPDRST